MYIIRSPAWKLDPFEKLAVHSVSRSGGPGSDTSDRHLLVASGCLQRRFAGLLKQDS